MVKELLTATAMVLLPLQAQAQSPALARGMLIASLGAIAGDMIITAASPDSLVEANPLFRGSRRTGLITNAIIAPGYGYVSWRLAKKHPKLIFWGALAVAAVRSYAIARNAREWRGQER